MSTGDPGGNPVEFSDENSIGYYQPMNIPIQSPFLERYDDNLQVQKAGRSCGANTFPERSLVYLTGAAELAAIASAGVACYGWSTGPSITPGTPPPQALLQQVYPFDVKHAVLIMSVTNAAVDTELTGTAATAPAFADVTIGQSYGIIVPTTGVLKGVQMLNVSNTTNKLLTVIGFYPYQSTADLNPRVLVRIVPATIQA